MKKVQFDQLIETTKYGGASRSILMGQSLTNIQKNKLQDAIDFFNENNRLELVSIVRIQQLQDKAVLEGLTDEEKKEYKELRRL